MEDKSKCDSLLLEYYKIQEAIDAHFWSKSLAEDQFKKLEKESSSIKETDSPHYIAMKEQQAKTFEKIKKMPEDI